MEMEVESELIVVSQDEETAFYKEAFDQFDWNHSGTIPCSVSLKIFYGADSHTFC